jgi:hypothetical protein
MGTGGPSAWVKRGRGVTLTTHSLLVPRSRTSTSLLLSLNACMVVADSFTFTYLRTTLSGIQCSYITKTNFVNLSPSWESSNRSHSQENLHFYGSWRINIRLTKARQWCLSWDRRNQPPLSLPITLRYDTVLPPKSRSSKWPLLFRFSN